MPDSLPTHGINSVNREMDRERAERVAGHIVDRVRALRTPLPSHALEGVDLRKWAVAVFSAEADHAEHDTHQIVYRNNWHMLVPPGSDTFTACRLPHEHHAGLALTCLTHVQTVEGQIRGPWSTWKHSTFTEKKVLAKRRRYHLALFEEQVGKYRAARAAPEVRRAQPGRVA